MPTDRTVAPRFIQQLVETLTRIVDWESVSAAETFSEAAYTHVEAFLNDAATTPEPARPEPEKVLAYPPHASSVVEAKPRQLGAHEQPEPVRLSAEEKKGLLMAADFIASVAERYPVEVFPPDGTSVDCHSARVMRHASKFLSAELRAMAEQDNDEELRALAAPPQEPR